MKFLRSEFYGLGFPWYAQDANGSIAKIVSDYGPIPDIVFSDKEAYSGLCTYMGILDPKLDRKLIKKYKNSRIKNVPSDLIHNGELSILRDGVYIYVDNYPKDEYIKDYAPSVKFDANKIPDKFKKVLPFYKKLLFSDLDVWCHGKNDEKVMDHNFSYFRPYL